MADLLGKVVLITGAASGIGRDTARRCLEAGARVALVDRDADRLRSVATDLGDDVCSYAIDITDETAVAATIDDVVERHGRLDGACNNAGVPPSNQDLHEIGIEAFRHAVSVNLIGTFLCLKHEIRTMLAKQAAGSIVNISAVMGVVAVPQAAEYVAAKHGVIGLTKSAALEYGRHAIRVNAVLPGMIQTPMTEQVLLNPVFAAKAQALREAHPLGRVGQPVEIAEAAIWLLSDAASFVSGVSLCVDGGYTAG